MADKSFDVVIVGGGTKAMVTGMYLAKYAGMSVGIFEKRWELGGGLATEQPAPGFPSNPHASGIWTRWHYEIVLRDFPELAELGIKNWYDESGWGATFYDGTNLCLCHENHDPSGEKTAEKIARFSEHDADHWLKEHKLWKEMWEPAMLKQMSNPPNPPGQPSDFELLMFNPDSGIDTQYAYMTPWQVLESMYESDEMKVLCLRALGGWGVYADDSGLGLFVPISLHGTAFGGNEGGTHGIAHAYQRVLVQNGAKIYTNAEVEEVLVENGKATGIRLKDGSEVRANKMVVTNVSPQQLACDLLPDHFGKDQIRKIKALEDYRTCISWFQWALHETPKYDSVDYDPIVQHCSMLVLGKDKNPAAWRKEEGMRRAYMDPPAPWLWAMDTASADPSVSHAPRGLILTEAVTVPAYAWTEKEWLKWQKQHADYVIDEWGKYCSNMTWDNVIGYLPVDPYTIATNLVNMAPAGNWRTIDISMAQQGGNRPIPELAQYNVPWIKGLYCTGIGWAPGIAATCHEGYNCYKVISKDFGLPEPWKNSGWDY